MADERVKPALTEQQWHEFPRRPMIGNHALRRFQNKPGARHAIAAVMLDGCSYGFTAKDAKLVREMADAIWPPDKRDAPAYSQAHALADRIAALVRPEESHG